MIDRLILDGEVVPIDPHLQPILTLVALGYPNRDIAAITRLTYKQVRTQVSELLTIAGVENRVRLALLAHGIDLSAHTKDF